MRLDMWSADEIEVVGYQVYSVYTKINKIIVYNSKGMWYNIYMR